VSRFNTKMVSYAWLQDNLFQFYQQYNERRFIACEEVYKEEMNTALECYRITQFFSKTNVQTLA
jgi:hypothetical protein